MGEAMLAALINKKIAAAKDITVADVMEQKRQLLVGKYGVKTTPDNATAAADADVVVLAVKPQVLADVMAGLKGKLRPSQLVLSIVAGARIATMENSLNHHAIVRSMPNTPAQIGEGVTVWTTTPSVTPGQEKAAAAIFGAMGKEFRVNEERYLDMYTAVGGSGPAYLFYFVEAFIEAAASIGWSKDMARELVLGTVYGAADLMKSSGRDPAELRVAVTSKGGTTAAALATLEEGKFMELMAKAVKAAYERAIELGTPTPPDPTKQ